MGCSYFPRDGAAAIDTGLNRFADCAFRGQENAVLIGNSIVGDREPSAVRGNGYGAAPCVRHHIGAADAHGVRNATRLVERREQVRSGGAIPAGGSQIPRVGDDGGDVAQLILVVIAAHQLLIPAYCADDGQGADQQGNHDFESAEAKLFSRLDFFHCVPLTAALIELLD